MMKYYTADVDLTDQVAIVTGGGRGLGRGMAHALASANAAVAVVARTEEQLAETVDLIRQAGGRALGIGADVTDREAVEKMVQTVQQELGPVDILVNNAAVVRPFAPIWELDPEEWQHALEVNLYGACLCSAMVLKEMTARRKGRIINVASAAALGPITYGSAYAVSKAALLRFTECLAADVRDYGITAFAIDPGTVRTDMSEYLMESEEGRTYAPWYRGYFSNYHVPAELSANLVTLLASGQVDRLSGRFIQVSDNVDELLSYAEQITHNDLYTLRLRTISPEAR
jgi:NAD(P)-dependent dehydrogenase (short-subunit alcohol dehydrogenase family)